MVAMYGIYTQTYMGSHTRSFHVLFTYTWHLNLKTAKSRQTKTLKNNLEFLLPQPTLPRQLIKSKCGRPELSASF